MALIKCPDCGRDVSSLAPACVGCGRPIAAGPAGGDGPGLHAPTPGPHVPESDLWEGRPSPALVIMRNLIRTGILLFFSLGVLFLVFHFGVPALAKVYPSFDAFLKKNEHAINDLTVRYITLGVMALVLFDGVVRVIYGASSTLGTHYRVTSQRILFERGILSKQIDEIDLRTIDDLRLQQSIVERFLGIGRLELVTADKVNKDFTLRGIRDPRAVRETIRSQVYAVSQRQIFMRDA